MNNLISIAAAVDYIENHLDGPVSLSTVAEQVGYSKYHVHRMFAAVVGVTIQTYVQRRRLTEAGRQLVHTDASILSIGQQHGYATQQSFTHAFRTLTTTTPGQYRRAGQFIPHQLPFTVDGNTRLRGDLIQSVRIETVPRRTLVGYHASTARGFAAIGRCWRQLQKDKLTIASRTDADHLFGVNDYTGHFWGDNDQPDFDHYAGVLVDNTAHVPPKMTTFSIPASTFVVFSYRGVSSESMQPVVEYIYGHWFPQSTCVLNEHAQFDVGRYGEEVDEHGRSNIEVWVPIVASDTASDA